MAAEEPVTRVDPLEAVAVAVAVLAARLGEADSIEVARLAGAAAQPVRAADAAEDARLVRGQREGVECVAGAHVPAVELLAAVQPRLLLEDGRQEPSE